MKVLFVHDGPILSNSTKTKYYGVHFTNEIVKRYSFFGDYVTFLMRCSVIKDSETISYSQIDHPAFRFIEVPNFKSIKSRWQKKSAENIIDNAVNDHDVIIVRLPSANGLIAKRKAEIQGKPVLIEVVACVFDALWNYDWRGKILAYFKLFEYRKQIDSAKFVIYVTDVFLQKRYPTQGISIGCSDVVLNALDENVLQKRINANPSDDKEIILGTVAAVDVPYKGQLDVIKALSVLKRKGITNLKYRIVGQGDPSRLMKSIEQFGLGQQVEILGSIPHDKVFDFLDSLDVYIQPSKTEGMPRAVVEALSRACPVIATNAGGLPELVNTEVLFESGDISGLVKLLENQTSLDRKRLAIENFNRSKDFQFDELNNKRSAFYDIFLSEVEMKLNRLTY